MSLSQLWPLFIILFILLLCIQLFHIHALMKSRKTLQKHEAFNDLSDKYLNHIQRLEQAHRAHHQSSVDQLRTTQLLLQDTQDYLTSIINSMPSMIIGVNRQGNITHWNSSATVETELLPHQVLGKSICNFQTTIPVSLDDIEYSIASGQAKHFKQDAVLNGTHSHQDITIYPLLSSGRSGSEGAVIRIDDISNQIQLESMLIQNNRLVSLGELTASLVHELNNPLASISQNTQALKRRALSEEPCNIDTAKQVGMDWNAYQQFISERDLEKLLTNIQKAGQRASEIIHNTLRYARGKSCDHQETNINYLIKNTVEILGIERKKPTVTYNLIQPAPMATVNSSEIQQVLINLIQNAEQALAGSNNPSLTIETGIEEKQVFIKVKDNGPGIAPEMLDRIFEPFYTTKDEGQGTGLGLSISHYIITEQHSGSLTVCSCLQQGTEFTINLPLNPSKNQSSETPSRKTLELSEMS